MLVAAESISDEKKQPDLLVVELSAVLSCLSLLKSVEASRHCVVDTQIVAVEVSSQLKEVLTR